MNIWYSNFLYQLVMTQIKLPVPVNQDLFWFLFVSNLNKISEYLEYITSNGTEYITGYL